MAETETSRPRGNGADDMEQLRADLDRLRQDIGTLAGTVRGIAASRSAQGEEAVRAYAETAYTEVRHAVEGVEQAVARNPLVALAAAFGVGWLIGRLMDRR